MREKKSVTDAKRTPRIGGIGGKACFYGKKVPPIQKWNRGQPTATTGNRGQAPVPRSVDFVLLVDSDYNR